MTLNNRKYLFPFILLGLFLQSCENPLREEVCEEHFEEVFLDTILEKSDDDQVEDLNTPCPLEEYIVEMGLVDVQDYSDRIMVDLRYASENNFLGQNLYGCLNRAYLQPEVAERLAKSQFFLDENYPHLRLYVFDAVRPLNVQQKMWNALDSIPVNDRIKFVSNPRNGSIHNFGAAVDLTIYDTILDTLLDMGADFDDMRLIAYPKLEEKHLKEGKLTDFQIQNRKLLRKAMKHGGFWVLPTEWWHFNAYSRDKSKQLFQMVDFQEETNF